MEVSIGVERYPLKALQPHVFPPLFDADLKLSFGGTHWTFHALGISANTRLQKNYYKRDQE